MGNLTVVVVNGRPNSGKDTMIRLAMNYIEENEYAITKTFSSIDPVKDVLKKFGWNGEKTDEIRALLSSLKKLWSDGDNGPTKYLLRAINDIVRANTDNSDIVIFVQIREMSEIKLLEQQLEFNYPRGVKFRIVNIYRSDYIDHGNESDDNTDNYYDIRLINDLDVIQFKHKVEVFVDRHILKEGN